MKTLTVTCRIARRDSTWSGGLGGGAQPALAGTHPDALHGVAAVLGQRDEAQVAQVATLLELVEALTRQGSAPAAATVGGHGLQRADAPVQHLCGEIGHECDLRATSGRSFRCVPLCQTVQFRYNVCASLSEERSSHASIHRRNPCRGRLVSLRTLRLWGRPARARRGSRVPELRARQL